MSRHLSSEQSSSDLPKGCVGRCGDCGMPLKSWDEHHTVDDCRWWKDTQPLRDACVAAGRLQEHFDAIVEEGTRS